jgi:hypothetical protein
LEVHTGELSRVLVPSESGGDSYFVDDDAMRRRERVEAAMVAKCAARGWFPLHQRNDVEELAMPGSTLDPKPEIRIPEP